MIATDWVTNGWLKCCLMYSRNFWLNKLSRRSECILPDRKTAASFDLAAVAVVTAADKSNRVFNSWPRFAGYRRIKFEQPEPLCLAYRCGSTGRQVAVAGGRLAVAEATG